MKLLLLGDVHGYYKPYKRIIDECTEKEIPTVQVGDMGIGFYKNFDLDPSPNPPYYAMVRGNHRFIRGNHDNLSVCKKHTQWIPDGTVEGNIMYVGGAVSIDRIYRTEGLSWWADEELSHEELYTLYDKYMIEKPEVMVTHECPEYIAHYMCAVSGHAKFNDSSRTRQAFDSMWSAYKPKLWIYGHWHRSFDLEIDGTRFICLNELEQMLLDTNTLEVIHEKTEESEQRHIRGV